MKSRAAIKMLLSIVLVIGMMALACGCKYSDYTTEKVFDTASEVKDPEAKVQINSPNAEKTSKDLPQVAYDENAEANDEVAVTPIAGVDQVRVAVPKVEYDEQTKGEQEASNPQQGQKKQDSTVAAGSKTSKKTQGKTSSGKKTSGKSDGSSGKGAGKNGKSTTGKGGAKRSPSEKKVYEDYGDFPEIPEGVKNVAVVGKNSATVAAIAGNGAILAGSSDFLSNKSAKKVLSKKISKAKALWDSAGKLKSVETLCKLNIQLVYVDEGSNNLTKSQIKKLIKAGILVYELPDLTSVSKIRTAADIVGQTFAQGGDEAAQDRADALVAFYDDLTSELKKKCGGNVAGGYDYELDEKVDSTLKNVYSLFISDWDDSARYKDVNGFLSSSEGAAIANLGPSWSPMSYLLSLGGVVDNASKERYSYLDGRKAFVWQFNQNKASATYANWTKFDASLQDYRIAATDGFTESLLWSMSGKCGLGSNGFPRVLVRSERIKDNILKDARRENGLYHPYPSVSSGGAVKVSVIGFYADGILCDSCIGTEGDAFVSSLNDGTTVKMYDVQVNPSGLFCSWVDGSIESILESAWVYGLYYDDSYDVKGKIAEFYKTIYGYELSDSELSAILRGPQE